MSASTYRFAALGTSAQVTVVAERAGLRTAGALLHDELEIIDRACSRFLATSELNAVNAGAGSPVGVSSVLFEAVATALRAAEATQGAVDPTVGGSPSSLGCDGDFALIGTDDGRRQVVRLRRRSMSWKRVRLDRERHTIGIPRGVELDLGATGKAFAADRAARRIADEIGSGVLVSLGGDIAVAGDPPEQGWPIRVTDDRRDLETIALRSGGLATSRSRSADGVERRHMWRTASVAAACCVDAHAASTAAIVLGEEAPAWLARLGLPARLVRNDGSVVAVAGWPAAEAR